MESENINHMGDALFELLTKHLLALGFTQRSPHDNRYFIRGEYEVFNCPHKCRKVAIYLRSGSRFPERVYNGTLIGSKSLDYNFNMFKEAIERYTEDGVKRSGKKVKKRS